MVTKHEAVCLWEDHVGDSGKAPTDKELHDFALAIEARTRKPFVDLVAEWRNRSEEILEKAEWMLSTDSDITIMTRLVRARAYSFLASRLSKTLNGD